MSEHRRLRKIIDKPRLHGNKYTESLSEVEKYNKIIIQIWVNTETKKVRRILIKTGRKTIDLPSSVLGEDDLAADIGTLGLPSHIFTYYNSCSGSLDDKWTVLEEERDGNALNLSSVTEHDTIVWLAKRLILASGVRDGPRFNGSKYVRTFESGHNEAKAQENASTSYLIRDLKKLTAAEEKERKDRTQQADHKRQPKLTSKEIEQQIIDLISLDDYKSAVTGFLGNLISTLKQTYGDRQANCLFSEARIAKGQEKLAILKRLSGVLANGSFVGSKGDLVAFLKIINTIVAGRTQPGCGKPTTLKLFEQQCGNLMHIHFARQERRAYVTGSDRDTFIPKGNSNSLYTAIQDCDFSDLAPATTASVWWGNHKTPDSLVMNKF